MKNIFLILSFITLFIFSCNSGKSPITQKDTQVTTQKNDTIHLKNDELEYDIIIIEPGFYDWLATQPPKGHYGLDFLENRNRLWVSEFNRRVHDPKYPKTLYDQEINYNPTVNYGLDVNYLLYNYLKYFQEKYHQKLF